MTIKKVFEEYKYLIDTHTAVAFNCAERFAGKNKMLVVSTASAYKFSRDVYYSLTGVDCEDSLEKLQGLTGVQIPQNLDGLAQKRVRFNKSSEVNKMGDYVREYLRTLGK
jgi:threonine synthase